MPAGLQIFNDQGEIVFDTNDRVLGGVYTISTGTASGFHEPVLQPGQKAGFYFRMPGTWFPTPGRASPWPVITSFDNRVQWSYTDPANAFSVQITVVIY